MKFIPILFSTQMVQAILAGRKTQTRRLIKPTPDNEIEPSLVPRSLQNENDWGKWYWETSEGETIMKPCPYGHPGNVLWVRETWAKISNGYEYKADDGKDGILNLNERYKPYIHMPKTACRIFLQVESIRVERLQDISRGDCMSEGCPFPNIAKETDPKAWFCDL